MFRWSLIKLSDYKLILYAVSLIGILFIATPALAVFINFHSEEPYTELYLLGTDNVLSGFPNNVTMGQTYSFNLGVTNHLGASAYYVILVKLRNGDELLPDLQKETSSALPALYELRFLLQNEQEWRPTISLSFINVSIAQDRSIIEAISINNTVINVNKASTWNSTSNLSYYQLFFELWLYNAKTDTLEFNNRFVALSMNYTQPVTQLT